MLADPLALDVILRNLLENALAAVAPVGGGSIAFTGAAGGWRRGRARGARQRRRLSARAMPRGSSRSSRACIRGGGSRFGTGLGLYIVRRLMQLAGGQVSAQSAGAGQGATFVLTWPRARHIRPPAGAMKRAPSRLARREQS